MSTMCALCKEVPLTQLCDGVLCTPCYAITESFSQWIHPNKPDSLRLRCTLKDWCKKAIEYVELDRKRREEALDKQEATALQTRKIFAANDACDKLDKQGAIALKSELRDLECLYFHLLEDYLDDATDKLREEATQCSDKIGHIKSVLYLYDRKRDREIRKERPKVSDSLYPNGLE